MAYYDNSNFTNSLPTVTRNLLIINGVIWLLCGLLRQTWLAEIFGLRSIDGGGFKIYQLITYMFTHIQFEHLFFNMFAVFMFGRSLEYCWGPKRFLTYYMVTGIGAGLIQLLICYLQGAFSITIGASGAVFGLLLAFGMIFPNVPLYLMFIPVPIKAKYMVIGYGVLEFFFGIANRTGDNVAHFAHLGGMLFGIFMILYWKKRGIGHGNGFF
ncbi:MAG: rhomboid family intramembrane serine protease [Dysgonamonadaceae bacterium]|jgi:membrane associated rhomboid family serine protease|nr:rhomboid family intramembrane serine protease [Dysgonamonadaceae bacterium]